MAEWDLRFKDSSDTDVGGWIRGGKARGWGAILKALGSIPG